jgi:tRNA(adenine34) deaminase
MLFDNKYMDLALEEAKKAYEAGEVPVGAVVVSNNGEVISKAHNLCEYKSDPTMHAEIIALKDACAKLGCKYLINCDLYVTLEPCPLCAAAISIYRIKSLYYGAYDSKFGAVESVTNFFCSKNSMHHPEIYSGIKSKEASELMKDFFKSLRANKNK